MMKIWVEVTRQTKRERLAVKKIMASPSWVPTAVNSTPEFKRLAKAGLINWDYKGA